MEIQGAKLSTTFEPLGLLSHPFSKKQTVFCYPPVNLASNQAPFFLQAPAARIPIRPRLNQASNRLTPKQKSKLLAKLFHRFSVRLP